MFQNEGSDLEVARPRLDLDAAVFPHTHSRNGYGTIVVMMDDPEKLIPRGKVASWASMTAKKEVADVVSPLRESGPTTTDNWTAITDPRSKSSHSSPSVVDKSVSTPIATPMKRILRLNPPSRDENMKPVSK